jgi:hypothetical protein
MNTPDYSLDLRISYRTTDGSRAEMTIREGLIGSGDAVEDAQLLCDALSTILPPALLVAAHRAYGTQVEIEKDDDTVLPGVSGEVELHTLHG